jgi:hypothetical protein
VHAEPFYKLGLPGFNVQNRCALLVDEEFVRQACQLSELLYVDALEEYGSFKATLNVCIQDVISQIGCLSTEGTPVSPFWCLAALGDT